MYIKKSKVVIWTIAIVLITSILTVCAVNPFGIANIGKFLKLSYTSKLFEFMYYKDVDLGNAAEMAIAGIPASVDDPYTGYMWGEEALEYIENVSGSFCGVGLYIQSDDDNIISVLSAIPGGPAEAQGITSGDKILKIDNQPYTGEELTEAANYMRGEEGSEVTLTIRSADDGSVRDVTLIRSEVEIECVSGEMLQNGIGYIRLTQFTENSSQKLAEKCHALKDEGMTSLIIDLRNNPGGLLDEAVAISSLFVPEGELVTFTLDKFDTKEEFFSLGVSADDKITLPLAVLINGDSASASEVLTGALRDHSLATIIGEKSFGKGVVQSVIPIGEGLLTVTVSSYYTPSGASIHGEGITPDIIVEMAPEKAFYLDKLEHSDDEQLQAAIKHLKSK